MAWLVGAQINGWRWFALAIEQTLGIGWKNGGAGRVSFDHADIAVLLAGQRGQTCAIAHHRRAQEHHQVAFDMALLRRAEQRTEQRNIAQQRNLGVGAGHVVLNQAAEHDHLAILGKNGAPDRTLVGDQIHGLCGEARSGRDGRDFLLDLQAQRGALIDVRSYLQRNADILPFDGGERIVRARGVGGIGTGLEGHVLTHEDFRLLVVQSQQARRRQQVALAVG
ncbi:hypothetical protein D3C77_511680 [compost metagenome]